MLGVIWSLTQYLTAQIHSSIIRCPHLCCISSHLLQQINPVSVDSHCHCDGNNWIASITINDALLFLNQLAGDSNVGTMAAMTCCLSQCQTQSVCWQPNYLKSWRPSQADSHFGCWRLAMADSNRVSMSSLELLPLSKRGRLSVA